MSMKLYYFDVRNLAEMSRMVLHYGNVPFEDVRVDQSEWPELKAKMLYGKLPVLELHGKQLGQSCAIARYLARKQGLAGRDEWTQAKVDELVHVQKDFYNDVSPFYYAAAGFGQVDKQDELYETVAKPVCAKYFGLYSQLLRSNGSGFFVGEHETYIDFWIAEFVYSLNKMAPDLLASNPDLLQHVKKIHSLPQLRSYITSRKDTLI